MANRFSTVVNRINKGPAALRSYLLTKVFNSQVKYAKTSNIKLISVTNKAVELKIANKKRVQNHIGGVHAIAASLLAESATGIVFGMNVPDTHVPLLKSMKVDFQRRMVGDLTAHANLTDEQIQQIETQDKGDMLVAVTITDESGQQPIACFMEWAWVPKRRD
ncbi:DUF4442 domain-containing protein [Thalassotalea sp. LPB0316]|uniref:DUF4442 domain-containing protein n=1 Tax=Thalassotalea sp. LPB0316 TaxID=2769490 RepID=UPI001867CAED|nr:DUF4442 domain-containing protein [Thalassotalea sp. LPB0316]QOL26527.1 DUF4442 domain-containing protein [Thalassotalea sp. LPB0316]